jgi:hypothetical protein
MKEEITLKLVQIQLQFKFLHWQTFGDAKHKAYGEIYEAMGDNIDKLVESMMGKYGRKVTLKITSKIRKPMNLNFSYQV